MKGNLVNKEAQSVTNVTDKKKWAGNNWQRQSTLIKTDFTMNL